MNSIYKSKWSESTQTWVACSELARGKCKSNGLKIVTAVALTLVSTSAIASNLDMSSMNITTDISHNVTDINGEVNLKLSGQNGHLKGTITQDNPHKFNILVSDHSKLSSNITSTKLNGSGQAGDVTITNKNYAIIDGDIVNKGTGRILINNLLNGFITSNITNSGDKDSSIQITNNKDAEFHGNVSNTGAGIISLENGGTSNSNIANEGVGKISINNLSNASIASNITNSGDKDSSIQITNNKDAEFRGNVSNTGAGIISLENKGISYSDITNSGDKDSSIQIINDKDAELQGDVNNTGAGIISLENRDTLHSNINNTDIGSITITNNSSADERGLFGSVHNSGIGNITLKNNGYTFADINNTGAGTISLENSDTLYGRNINNTDTGSITITNNSTGSLSGTILNSGTGTITLKNNNLTATEKIINSGNGEIKLINNNLLSTDITNNGNTGSIIFNNTGDFFGKIINTNSGIIGVTNTRKLASTINNSGFTTGGQINLTNEGTWVVTKGENSTLHNLINETGTIHFTQLFAPDNYDRTKYHNITVQGDYTGGGTIYVNTLWDKDGTTYSDRLDIKGNVLGEKPTEVTVYDNRSSQIVGDISQPEIGTIYSAPVIRVEGQINGTGFTGNVRTKNAGAAQLSGRKVSQPNGTSATEYAWTLTATKPTDPAKPIKPTPPKEVPIYAEPVSAYVQMPTVDMELGFTTIGTLHERRGENQTYNITGANNTALGDKQQQTWGRVLVKHLDKNGKRRLDTAGNQSVLQIGHDFILDENNKTGTRRHIGGYVAYGHNENDFRDQYRAENGYIVDDHYTGKGRTDAVSVGGYGTFYGNNGGYVDLVGQVTYLRNKYNARTNESVHQNGWGAAVSAEAGKSFTVYGNNWFVEPQAQLVYQYLSLDNFNDGIRHIDQHNPSALRGRVGMRFGYNGTPTDNLPPSSFYGIANIWHDFVNPKSVDIGRDSLKEEYAKTWGEVGVGIQLPITRQSHFYGDVRYEKNFGSDKRKGFKGTLGYKYTWL
ncbi:autotransporter outer membrane beta-barrel domain-containing protein [Snodgrassella gandavensis]|uniref:autotransporter outer membrane beta-barrel domain-containing protein n=1 Tax=Snodgrassella gandavensis TaxID=2946698 RepID=UPI001EF4F6E7|nr:autotransporter outer membrane beta-barrel domain-containing protein [Snodgrassella gandavensis]